MTQHEELAATINAYNRDALLNAFGDGGHQHTARFFRRLRRRRQNRTN